MNLCKKHLSTSYISDALQTHSMVTHTINVAFVHMSSKKRVDNAICLYCYICNMVTYIFMNLSDTTCLCTNTFSRHSCTLVCTWMVSP